MRAPPYARAVFFVDFTVLPLSAAMDAAAMSRTKRKQAQTAVDDAGSGGRGSGDGAVCKKRAANRKATAVIHAAAQAGQDAARFKARVRARRKPAMHEWIFIGYAASATSPAVARGRRGMYRGSIACTVDGLQIFKVLLPSGREHVYLWTSWLRWRPAPPPPTLPVESPAAPRLRLIKPEARAALRLRLTKAWRTPPPFRILGTCPAPCAGGGTCGGVVVFWPYCSHHLDTEYGICIKPSQIPGAGNGVWTTRKLAVAANSGPRLLMPYGGEIISPKTLALRNPDGKPDYVIACHDRRFYLDSTCKRGVGAMANNSMGKKYRTNAQFDGLSMRAQEQMLARGELRHYELCAMWVVLWRTVQAGREIFVNYNNRDWSQAMKETMARAQAPVSS
jgi:hypothetical protein